MWWCGSTAHQAISYLRRSCSTSPGRDDATPDAYLDLVHRYATRRRLHPRDGPPRSIEDRDQYHLTWMGGPKTLPNKVGSGPTVVRACRRAGTAGSAPVPPATKGADPERRASGAALLGRRERSAKRAALKTYRKFEQLRRHTAV
jgi:hypothetical protein